MYLHKVFNKPNVAVLCGLGNVPNALQSVLSSMENERKFMHNSWGGLTTYNIVPNTLVFATLSDGYHQDCLLPTFEKFGYKVVGRPSIPNPIHHNESRITTVYKVYT